MIMKKIISKILFTFCFSFIVMNNSGEFIKQCDTLSEAISYCKDSGDKVLNTETQEKYLIRK